MSQVVCRGPRSSGMTPLNTYTNNVLHTETIDNEIFHGHEFNSISDFGIIGLTAFNIPTLNKPTRDAIRRAIGVISQNRLTFLEIMRGMLSLYDNLVSNIIFIASNGGC